VLFIPYKAGQIAALRSIGLGLDALGPFPKRWIGTNRARAYGSSSMSWTHWPNRRLRMLWHGCVNSTDAACWDSNPFAQVSSTYGQGDAHHHCRELRQHADSALLRPARAAAPLDSHHSSSASARCCAPRCRGAAGRPKCWGRSRALSTLPWSPPSSLRRLSSFPISAVI